MIRGRDDADLLIRLRGRDPEALGVLYDRYGNEAYDLAFRIVGDPATAENVVAQAMLKCWNRVFTFREARRSALGVWFIALTYQAAMEHIERSGSKALESPALFQDWSKIIDPDRVREAHSSLQKLDPEERQLLELAFYEGLPPGESASRLGRSRSEMESVIQSGLAKLASADHD